MLRAAPVARDAGGNAIEIETEIAGRTMQLQYCIRLLDPVIAI